MLLFAFSEIEKRIKNKIMLSEEGDVDEQVGCYGMGTLKKTFCVFNIVSKIGCLFQLIDISNGTFSRVFN